MILLDTSFLYAFFHREDTLHKEAHALADVSKSESAKIPLEIFEELITVISRKKGSHDALQIGRYLLDGKTTLEIIPPIPSQFSKTWIQFQMLSPHQFSYVDCLLITLAKEYSCPVLTFDKALEEQLKQSSQS